MIKGQEDIRELNDVVDLRHKHNWLLREKAECIGGNRTPMLCFKDSYYCTECLEKIGGEMF